MTTNTEALPEPFTRFDIMSIANKQATEVADYDFAGGVITEADVALMGAYRPLIERIVNACAHAHAAKLCAAKDAELKEQLQEMRESALAQYVEGRSTEYWKGYAKACQDIRNNLKVTS